jgi:Cu-Zn family superoxide dismutase
MRRGALLVSVLVACFSLIAASRALQVGSQEGTPGAGPAATPGAAVEVTLHDKDGQEVGTATLTEGADGVTIAVEVEGLAPGDHGIHVHETGVCDPAGERPFASAGGHYNPTGAMHGGPDDPDSHAGDLGNLTVEGEGGTPGAAETPAAGMTRFEITTDRFGLAELNDADGSALVIHADPDDLVTDPAGNSGARVACGVIFASTVTPEASPAATPSG